MSSHVRRILGGLVVLLPGMLQAVAQPCTPVWTADFAITDLNAPARCMALFDDGAGEALYVGGDSVTSAGQVPVRGIAKWDGAEWSDVGGGLANPGGQLEVAVMEVFNDGTAPALYVGGRFTRAGDRDALHLARWDGLRWKSVGAIRPISGGATPVAALAGYDDGTGPALYVGGTFDQVGGLSVLHLARWNGVSWSKPGVVNGPAVNSMRVFDDGTGPALYVGGSFLSVGAKNARNIARYKSGAWSALGGSGLNQGTDGVVRAMTLHDNGSGPALYVAGSFGHVSNAGATLDTPLVARWSGQAWSGVGASGLASNSDAGVNLIASVRTAQGVRLVIGGSRLNTLDGRFHNLVIWDGQAWSEGNGNAPNAPAVLAGVVRLGASSDTLFVGGDFVQLKGVRANRVAQWTGGVWSALTPVQDIHPDRFGRPGDVGALAIYDVGGGPKMYVAGNFQLLGVEPCNGFATWDGSALEPVRDVPFRVLNATTMHPFQGQGDTALYLAGRFDDSINTWYLERFDGRWTPLPIRMLGSQAPTVNALTTFDDGSGPALYAAGRFTTPEGVNHIARWDWAGYRWWGLGSNSLWGASQTIRALAVFDDGTGSRLYAAGNFGTVRAWDGAVWSEVASTFDPRPESLYSLHVFGGELHGAGTFNAPGRPDFPGVARHDGDRWTLLGELGGALGSGAVTHLFVFDNGSGPALYAAGVTTLSGPVTESMIFRWSGAAWYPVAAADGPVNASATFRNGAETSLFLGGGFSLVGPQSAGSLARWRACERVCPADFNGDGVLDESDLDAFLEAFEGASGADFDGDGFSDGIDYDQFMLAYEAGCGQ